MFFWFFFFFTCVNCIWWRNLRKSPPVTSVRQTLGISKSWSLLIRLCILSDLLSSSYTYNFLSSYWVFWVSNTPNKACWEKMGVEKGGVEKKELCLKRNIWLKREALGITRHYHTISDSIAYKWLMEALRELLLLSTHTSHELHQLWTLYMKLEEKQDLRWEDEKKNILRYYISTFSTQ